MATPYFSNNPNDKKAYGEYQRAQAETQLPTPTHSSPAVQQPTAPTDVATVNNATQGSVMRNRFNPSDEGLRAVLQPYQARGNYRNLTSQERNSMQMGYRDIANMKGLSNRQRQQGLLQMKEKMAAHGIKPTFDLSSEKGLSQRQIMQNRIDGGALDRAVIDNQQRIAGANNWQAYQRDKFWDDYRNWLLEE